jgi:hypothetical protein
MPNWPTNFSLRFSRRVHRTSNTYGFSINQSWGDAWLINNIPVWRTVQSAFVLQVRERWIRDSEGADAVLATLKRQGFQTVSSWEYVYPLRVSESSDSDLVNAVVSQAQEVLARIRADLEG